MMATTAYLNTTPDNFSGINNGSSPADETSFLEYEISVIIRKVFFTVLLLLGGFGNTATIFVLSRIKGNYSSHHLILIALAVVDWLLLNVGLLREWVRVFFQVDVRTLHGVLCKLHMWFVYSMSSASAWLVTCVTVQRTIAVRWPHRMRTLCTRRRTRLVTAAVLFTPFLLQSHVLVGCDTTQSYGCGALGWYHHFFHGIWSWVDMLMASILPSLCLLVCDVLLSLALYKRPHSTSTTIHAIAYAKNAKHINRRKKTASKTTLMILVLSCTFLILTLPVCVYLVWDNIWYEDIVGDDAQWANTELAYTVAIVLWYTNSAVNFVLYCITGTRFRTEFVSWLCCGANADSRKSAYASCAKRCSQQGHNTSVDHLQLRPSAQGGVHSRDTTHL